MNIQPFSRDIAIIGMACKFPGASDPEEYWHNLVNGVESIVELDHAPVDKQTIPFAAPLNGDILSFDAAFFGVGPRDAALMDPQHRLFLECAWHALEHAGIQPGRLEDMGLFAGCSSSAYLPQLLSSELMEKFKPSNFDLQITNDKDYLVTRTAWHLGIEGPVLSVQAACATSLVAVAEAVEALRAGRCRLAMAGGCTVRFPQHIPYQAQQGMIYSRNGHCMPFARDASGTVFGSGVAVVVLKPLVSALTDGDNILAVIKGCAVNNDGARKVGFTTTSADGQRRLVDLALKDAVLTPADIRAIETHGTGTIAGDPIEFNALNTLFSKAEVAPSRCALGAVKANVGHLETCAGMAGLIKAVLEIQHGWIAPQIHIEEVNPSISIDASPFYFPLSAESWDKSDSRTAIGISAFGIGGTNAHIVLARPYTPDYGTQQLPSVYPAAIPISGKSEAACYRLMQAYRKDCTESATDALAWSSQTTRRAQRYRTILLPDAQGILQTFGDISDGGQHRPHIVFQFPGQGSQFIGMATDLAKTNRHFASLLNGIIDLLRESTNTDISFLLHGNRPSSRLTDTSVAQPALIAVQIAMARFLMQHGIMPDMVIGHSLGEIAAACVAGVFSEKQALRFAAQRGQLMAALPFGSMLAVALSETSCIPWLSNDVSLAAINGVEASVLSGTSNSIRRVQAALFDKGIRSRELTVSHAFHSSMMDPILQDLKLAAPVPSNQNSHIKFCSTLLGSVLNSTTQLDSAYWARHAREPVRFLDALDSLPVRERTVFVEVGPGTTLTALTKARRPKDFAIRTMCGERDESPEHEVWHMALQRLWLSGVTPDWRPSWDKPGSRIPLPLYPFDRQHHGIASGSDNYTRLQTDDVPLHRASKHVYETLEAAVTGLWEMAIGVSPSNPHRSFSDDGGDSLAAIQLVVLADTELGIKVNISDFMREPTPNGLYTCLTAAGATNTIRKKQ
ncbi:phenolpthiocerol synthesis type-I polyketide synthase PpsE [Xenorhabdus beddingii]|uniref:Phenolpthiocerol synthesis type-I polyketide synthase PpsE n=1 Tax=Xenorhabdus beddingii TaxID=40578 RepID=A0A1Y2SPE6_9GAMM|nr:type I polyketide synthase [Xenorhabdus beddingii]OTA20787.1 phenolpthiocerol synthesis type-I polyketide synthase PpsE [Xenorhabdus beddingii]